MTAERERVDEVRRRLLRANLAPMVARLQLLTMMRQPSEAELTDALLRCSMSPSTTTPVDRVFLCWTKWLVVMAAFESFGAYARRNIGGEAMTKQLMVRRRLMATAHKTLIEQAERAHGWEPDHIVDMLIACNGSQAWLETLYAAFQQESPHQFHGQAESTERSREHGLRLLNYVRYHTNRDQKERA